MRIVGTAAAQRCPTLFEGSESALQQRQLQEALSAGRLGLLEMRSALLNEQLFAVFDQYKFRLQSVAATTIQSQFCRLILQYACGAMNSFLEEAKALKVRNLLKN